MGEKKTFSMSLSQSYSMQIRMEAMLLTSIKMQAEIISHQQGKEYEDVYNKYIDDINENARKIQDVLVEESK
jgi:hypothetical protein